MQTYTKMAHMIILTIPEIAGEPSDKITINADEISSIENAGKYDPFKTVVIMKNNDWFGVVESMDHINHLIQK